MNAASFHKTENILDFIRNSEPLITITLIPPGLTSLVQPLDTAVNSPFKQFLREEADICIKEFEYEKRIPNNWSVKDRRIIVIIIVAQAWDRLRANIDLICENSGNSCFN
jgi:hypothetical protein